PKSKAVITCGAGGLWRVPIDGIATPERLDPERCIPTSIRHADLVTSVAASLVGDAIFYWSGKVDDKGVPLNDQTLRAVPRVGTSLPRQFFHADGSHHLLALAPMSLAWSEGAPGNTGTDGKLDDWRFMDSGRAVTFSSDGQRLRWLE